MGMLRFLFRGVLLVGTVLILFATHGEVGALFRTRGKASAATLKHECARSPAISATGPVITKAIVVSKYKEDTNWVDLFLGDMPHYIYNAYERVGAMAMPKNAGNEASGFLRYIVDHYEALPDRVAFIHGHRNAHHTFKMDIVPFLRAANWSFADYVPINLDMYQRLTREKSREFALVQDLWPKLFAEVAPEPPKELFTWCCAQFITSRHAIRRMSKAHWQRLYEWILADELGSWTTSRVMEHAWPIMLGAPHEAEFIKPCDVLDCEEFERLRAELSSAGA